MAIIIECFAFPTATLLLLLVLSMAGVLGTLPLVVCLALMGVYIANVWHRMNNDGRELFRL